MYLVLSLGYGGGVDPFTESLSVWGWQGPLEVILSIPHAQPGPPPTSYSRHCLDSFLVSSRMEIPLSGQSVPVLHSPSQWKYYWFRGSLLCFSECPSPLVLSLGTTAKSLAPSFSLKFLLSMPFSGLNSPNSQPFLFSEMLQSLRSVCIPSLVSLQYVQYAWGSQLWTQYSRCSLTSAE